MGFTRQLPELEAWLAEHAATWQLLSDPEYRRLVEGWESAFRSRIASRNATRKGSRALYSLTTRLPADVFLLSGVSIPEVANLGGRGAAAYRASSLESLEPALARRLELILVAEDLSWCVPFSHETGSLLHEELYEA